ncbi:MAG: RNA-binding S4 domain-containing protein [Verrucomicrobia bacterium]|nr:RNA-binding S4 domain-containing protein [Verrucomicrobiota bacterium]
MNTPGKVRMDKWLWAVRLFKTRSAAAAACNGGHVKIDGVAVKPARAVKVGDAISAQTGDICRSGKVLGLLEQRVGAKLVPQYFEDQTPAAELERHTSSPVAPGFHRPKGSGRPTKKERRTLERFWG